MNHLAHPNVPAGSLTQTSRRRPGRIVAATLAASALVATLGTVAHTANPESGITSTGQGLAVEITPSKTGPIMLGDSLSVDVTASLGAASTPSAINYLSVVDVSGSMENPTFNPFRDIVPPEGIGPEDDCNGDGIRGSAMDAACFGLLSMNASLGNPGNVSVGLVAFGNGAVTADVDPAPGVQAFTSPPNVDKNGNGIPDMEEVIRSLDTQYAGGSLAGVGVFTDMMDPSFATGTDYNAALEEMNAAFASAPAGNNFAAFLSDGTPSPALETGVGSALAEAADAGTTIHTFALGTIAPGSCDEGEALREVADATDGACTEVDDPSDLSAVFAEVLTTRITSIELTVGGQSAGEVTGSEAATMRLADADITSLLEEGANVVTATVTAADGTTVTADLSIEVTAPDASIVVTVTPEPATVEAPGGPVDFTVAVANDGDVEVTITELTDDRFGDLDGLGDCATPFTLTPGAAPETCTFTGEVSGAAGDSHVSVVTAEGTSEAGPVSDTASATVGILAGATPSPTPTPTPTSIPSPTPTSSPSPSTTPTGAPTPTSTVTVSPSPMPSATVTVRPPIPGLPSTGA